MSKKSSEAALGIIVIIIAAIYLLIKVLLYVLPFIIGGFIIYRYFKWQNLQLERYDNNWKAFYDGELRSTVKVLLFLSPLALIGMYLGFENRSLAKAQEQEVLAYQQAQDQQRKEAEAKRAAEAQAKRDSSINYLQAARSYREKKHYKTSLLYLDSSLTMYPENHAALFEKGVILKKRKKYAQAEALFDSLNHITDQYRSEGNLERGRCLLKMKKKKDAALAVYRSMKLGNAEAEKLYEKINPFIRRIIGYTTRCCDGSTSSATGRGACSHHGGVCNWNDPIYSRNRKYQITEQ